MSIVYQHRRKDTNDIFYIGIGESKTRAYSKSGRNRTWHQITSNTEYTVEILHDNLTREQAKEIERTLIKEHGRLDKNQGKLANKSNGGEGDNIGGSGPLEGWQERQNILDWIRTKIPESLKHMTPSQFMAYVYRLQNSSNTHRKPRAAIDRGPEWP